MTVHGFPPTLGYAAPLGDRKPSTAPGTLLATASPDTLVIVDGARFARGRRGNAPADLEAALLRMAASVPQLDADLVRVRTDDLELVGRLDVPRPSIVPHSASWDRPTGIRDITAVSRVGDALVRVVFLPDGSSPPSGSLAALIGVLAMLAGAQSHARSLHRALLGPHRVAIRTPTDFTPVNLPDRPVLRLTSEAHLIWSSPGHDRVIELHDGLVGLTTGRGRGGAAEVAAPHLLAFIDRLATAGSLPVDGNDQILSGGSWHAVDGTGRPDVMVDGLARVRGDGRATLLPRSPVPLAEADEAFGRLLDRTAPVIDVTSRRAERAVGTDHVSIAEAYTSTVEYLRPWFGTVADPEVSARIIEALRLPDRSRKSPLTAELRELMRRTTLDDLEPRHRGRSAIVRIAVERGVDEAATTTPDRWARSITSYLAVHTEQQREPQQWLPRMVVRFISQWLMQRRINWAAYEKLPPHLMVSERILDLVAAAPWVRWFAPVETQGPPVRLTERELIEVITLLRPNRVLRPRANAVDATERVPFPPRFRAVFSFPDAETLSDGVLDQLAEGLMEHLHRPIESARRLQGVDLPKRYRALLDQLFAVDGETPTVDQVLAIRADTGDEARLVVVNLSPDRRLAFSLSADRGGSLDRAAFDTKGATAYAVTPIVLTRPHVLRVGDAELDLDVPPKPMAAPAGEMHFSIDKALFRGRSAELDQLRVPLLERGRRTGSLIVGNRRAGKTTLAWRVREEPGVRAGMFLDLASVRWDGIDGWNRRAVRELAEHAWDDAGIRLDPEPGMDFVEALQRLDRLAGAAEPIVLILDELDVLLTVDETAEARRLAGRLGALAPANLVLIGTVQRFHRATAEFKSWQLIDCPADLTWGDGITYFLPALAEDAAGPRVEQLDRAALLPQVFKSEVVETLGYRPYFWGQLRARLDALVRFDERRSRVVGPEDTRAACDRILALDAHLAAPLDVAPGLTVDEARRRDLFSAEERRILLRFAELADGKEAVSRVVALREGGVAALDSLLDRGYLSRFENDDQLRTAVPIYHRFLRSRLGQLRDVVAAETGEVAPQGDLP